MSIFKGERLTIDIFGESHSEEIGAKVQGMPTTKLDEKSLEEFLNRRKAKNAVFSTPRKEADEPIFSGITDGIISDKYSFVIKNGNVKKSDYDDLYAKPRPSHADYARYLKEGTLDFSGGGRFSGRMTAPLCVAGGICKQYLADSGVEVVAYVSSIGNALGRSYKNGDIPCEEAKTLSTQGFPSLDGKKEMLDEIERAASEGDSIGGTVECIVYGLKGGLGDNLFGGLEGKIASLVYAIPGVKGVEFGAGFDLSKMRGSEANDPIVIENGKIKVCNNFSGGINGGISNGENLTLRVAFRPTPSISKPQRTVDLVKAENTTITVKGRHDSCIVPRAVPCVESMVCIALTDIL